MKKIALSMVLVLALFMGCKKEDPIDDPNNSNEPETGVEFTCRDSLGGIEGVIVGIAPEASGCNSGNFIRSGDTGANGKVKFKSVDPQDLCYSATRTTTSGNVTRTGSFTVYQDSLTKVIVEF